VIAHENFDLMRVALYSTVKQQEKESLVIRIFTTFVLVLCFGCAALAQEQDSKTRKMLDKARENGRELPVNVSDNVSAQAVLIPQVDARRIFGKEIADHYAVIEVNVGNKSKDAALIIHGIFIDYSRWPLSGVTSDAGTTVESVARDRFYTFQSSTRPSHVASEEYRVVRGQLLDAQLWTKRNLIVRLLTLAGSVAGAYTFSISEQGFTRGIAAFNGVVVPGISTAWHDSTVDQLNRVSDLGYRANKLIPKEGSDVVVCFFPIDRFLTPGFKRLFLKSPALFFAPLQMVVDRSVQRDVEAILGKDLGIKTADLGITKGSVLDTLRENLPCYLRLSRDRNFGIAPRDKTFLGQMNENADATCLEKFGLKKSRDSKGVLTGEVELLGDEGSALRQKSMMDFSAFLLLDYLGQVSLNNVGVTIDGVMTLDTSAIEAKIDGVSFDDVTDCGGPDKECFWSVPAGGSVVRTGKISGSYLTGGSVLIDEANDLGITEVKSVADKSTDQELHFSFKLTKGISTGTKLTFKVTKPKQGSSDTIDSQSWVYPVSFFIGTPTISKVEFNNDDSTVTITGDGFIEAPPPNALSEQLMTPDKDVLKDFPNRKVEKEKIVLTIPANQKKAGCWTAMVQAGGRDASPLNKNADLFEVPRSPKLTSAKVQGNKIVVVGTDLVIGMEKCGGKTLHFQLVKKTHAEGDIPLDVTINSMSSKGGELKLPSDINLDLDWELEVLLGDAEVSGDNGHTALQK